MSKLLWSFRIVLVLVALGFGMSAMNEADRAAHIQVEGTDPDSKPEYQHLRGLGAAEAYLADPQLASSYVAERATYRGDISSTELVRIGHRNNRDIYLTLAAVCSVFLVVTLLPWQVWFNHRVEEIAEFTGKVVPPIVDFLQSKLEPGGTTIIGREKLKRFSTADEMLKWKKLLDQGVITQSEFDEARRKLLNREL
jgi:hypothetical protein